jgi:hypothetical protein
VWSFVKTWAASVHTCSGGDQRDYSICVLRSVGGGKHWTSTLGVPRPAVSRN